MFVAQLLPELFYGAFGACCRQRPPTWTDGPGTRAEPQASGRAGERPVGAATGALSPPAAHADLALQDAANDAVRTMAGASLLLQAPSVSGDLGHGLWPSVFARAQD